MTNFKIPKKQGKKAAKALTVGPADVDENGLIIGTSGKILGYLPEQPATSAAPPSLVVEIPMKSKIGNGVYLPIIPATGPGSGQPKAGPSGVGQEGTEKPCQDVGGNAVNPATLASETKPEDQEPGPSNSPSNTATDEGQEGAANNALDDGDASIASASDSPIVVDPTVLDFEPYEQGEEEEDGSVPDDYSTDDGKLLGKNLLEMLNSKESEEESVAPHVNTGADGDATSIVITDKYLSENYQDSPYSESPSREQSGEIMANSAANANGAGEALNNSGDLDSSLVSKGIFTQYKNNLVTDLSDDGSYVACEDEDNTLLEEEEPGKSPVSSPRSVLDTTLTEQPPAEGVSNILVPEQVSSFQPPVTSTAKTTPEPKMGSQPESASTSPEQQQQQQQLSLVQPPPKPDFSVPPPPLPQLSSNQGWVQDCDEEELRRKAAEAAQKAAAAMAASVQSTPPPPKPTPTTSTPARQDQSQGKVLRIASDGSIIYVPVNPAIQTMNSSLSNISSISQSHTPDPPPSEVREKLKAKRNSANDKVASKESNTPTTTKNSKSHSENNPKKPVQPPPPVISDKEVQKPSTSKAGSNAVGKGKPTGKGKNIRKKNPRPDLLVLPDIALEDDTRRLRDGYVYTTKEKYVQDKEFVRIALLNARAEVAIRIFGTDTIDSPTPTLKKFWVKSGIPRNRSINDVVAQLLNSVADGWPQLYNKWMTMDQDTEEWAEALEALQNLAATICIPSKNNKKVLAKKKEGEAGYTAAKTDSSSSCCSLCQQTLQ